MEREDTGESKKKMSHDVEISTRIHKETRKGQQLEKEGPKREGKRQQHNLKDEARLVIQSLTFEIEVSVLRSFTKAFFRRE
jgi:hypothetical protein